MATPTLVQHVVWIGSGNGDTSGNAFILRLPNATLSNNCQVLCLQYPSTATLSSIAGNVNSWSTTPVKSVTDSGNSMTQAVFVLAGATAGDTQITVTFSAAQQGFEAAFQEWNNIATTTPTDGSAAVVATVKTALASGSFNTTTDGDLILHFVGCTDNGSAGVSGHFNGITQFTKATGCTLSQVNLTDGYFSEYQIQATHGATNPSASCTATASLVSFPSITIALKSAAAGTAPSATATRVFGMLHSRIIGTGGTGNLAYNWQFPTTGNTLALTVSDPTNSIKLVSVSGTASGSWTAISSSGGDSQGCYKTSATASTDEMLTVTLNDATAHAYVQGVTYDIVNGGAFDQAVHHDDGTSFGPGNSSASSLTPGVASGIVLAVAGIATGPPDSVVTPSGAVFLCTNYTGQSDLSFMDNGDFHAAFVYGSNAAQSWVFHNTATSAGGYDMLLISFAAATSAQAAVAWSPSTPPGRRGPKRTFPRQAWPSVTIRNLTSNLSATQATSATLAKQAQLTRSATEASTPTLVKGAQLVRTATEATTATMGARTVGIVRSVTQAESLTLAKVIARTLSLTQASAATLVKAVAHTFATVTQATSAVLVKAGRLIRSATQATLATLTAIKVHLTVLSVTQATSVTLAKAVAIARSVSQVTTATRVLAAQAIRSLTQASGASLVKSVGIVRSVTQASVATLLHTLVKFVTMTVSQATAATLSKMPQLVRAIGQATSVTRSLAVQVTRSLAQATSLAIAKGVRLARALTQATVATLLHGLLKFLTLAASQATAVLLVKMPTLVRSAAQATSAALTKMRTAVLVVTQSTAATLSKAIAKVVSLAQATGAALTAFNPRSFLGGPRFVAARQRMRAFLALWSQPRRWAASRPAGRLFTVSAVSSPRFDTKLPSESVVLTFDATPDLLTSETLTGTPTIVSIVTSLGTDNSPTAIENGAATLDPTAKKVLVPVQAGLDLCDYDITVKCNTSNPAKVWGLLATLPVRAKP